MPEALGHARSLLAYQKPLGIPEALWHPASQATWHTSTLLTSQDQVDQDVQDVQEVQEVREVGSGGLGRAFYGGAREGIPYIYTYARE